MADEKYRYAPSESRFFSDLLGGLSETQKERVQHGLTKHADWTRADASHDTSGRVASPGSFLEKESASASPHQAMFLRVDVCPRIYADYLTSRYGAGWLKWEEPETAWMTIERDLGMEEGTIHQVAKDKISVLRSLFHQDTIFQEMDAYENAVLAWNDELADIGVLEKAEPEQIYYFTVLHDRLFRKRQPEFDVRKYVAAIFGGDGWIMLPPRELGVFQADLDEYNRQKMSQAHLDGFKERLKNRLQSRLKDDDEDPIEIAVARMQKLGLYASARDQREKEHRREFGVRSTK